MTTMKKKVPFEYIGWKEILARYPRLVACMIEESLGYFTPKAAVNALRAHKLHEKWSCEWYMDIDAKQQHGGKICWSDPDYDERMMKINHDIISNAFRRRKHFLSANAKKVVKMNLGGNESIGASWF